MTGNEAALDAAGYTLKLMEDECGGGLDGLLRRARHGDLDAFEEIVRVHERLVFRIALRVLGNVADAQDVAQEVFMKLHRSLSTFDAVRDFRPWLNRVTVNACTDALRRRKIPLTLEYAASVTQGIDPERATGLEERRELLLRGLDQLSPKQRAAIVLRDIEGLSTADVAAALGSTEATVRSHIAVGRTKLKELLTELLRGRP